ncbi:MAG: TetR/AcrR family transcriptional regulator [Candidatus Nomurabacteria bacterium]|jgi:AcrR family transcriptional regulator|nr:TetR/AcrR family transcriptional regulator [Candidatus Nomurabacteria bacterium]
MSSNTEDRRYQNSAKKIHDALACLLEKKNSADISDVTIQEICEKAGVTRGTFYRHYKSISAIIVEAEDYLFSEYIKILYGTPESERIPKRLVRNILEIVGKNRAYFRMVFARYDYRLMLKIFEITKPLLQDSWKHLNYTHDRELLDKMYYFCAYGLIGEVKHWVIEKNCDSALIDEYTDFIFDLAHNGMNHFTDQDPSC